MFRLAPIQPSSFIPLRTTELVVQPTKAELLSSVDLWTEEALNWSAGPSKDGHRILQRTDSIVKELTAVLDDIFCYRLKSSNRRYWPAVREFQSHSHTSDLFYHWGPVSERGLSLAWLFQSLNDATLGYQLLGFRQGRRILLRFYHQSAYLLDPALLQSMSDCIYRLQHVVFDLKPPEQRLPNERWSCNDDYRIPIAKPVANGHEHTMRRRTPPDRKVSKKKKKKMCGNLTNNRTLSDNWTETGVEIGDTVVISGRDQDDLFDRVFDFDSVEAVEDVHDEQTKVSCELLCRKSVELTSDRSAAAPFQKWFDTPVLPPTVSVVVDDNEQDFDEMLRKRLSMIKLDQSSNFSDSIDLERPESEILENGFIRPSEKSDWKFSENQEGEILLESGEIVSLAVQVFVEEGERFYKLYRVYLQHHTGLPMTRWLLLTNYAVYLLTFQDVFRAEASLEYEASECAVAVEVQEELENYFDYQGDSNRPSDRVEHCYEIDKIIQLNSIDYVSVGLDFQLFTVAVGEKRKNITLCTCNEPQTRSILASIELAVRRCARGVRLDPPAVLTDATPQRVALRKWARTELDDPCLDIVCYSLIYWKSSSLHENATSSMQIPSKAGYLYHRQNFPRAWLKTSTEWQYSYFLLGGQKLYQFSDSSCKIGEKIFDLRRDIVGCRLVSLIEHLHCLELLFPDSSHTLQLSCQTDHDSHQWTGHLLRSLSSCPLSYTSDDQFVACFSLLTTSGHLLFGQESSTRPGFVRTLTEVLTLLKEVDRAHVVRTNRHKMLVLNKQRRKRFWMAFRTAFELDRMVDWMRRKTQISIVETGQDRKTDSLVDSSESSIILEKSLEIVDLWRTCRQF